MPEKIQRALRQSKLLVPVNHFLCLKPEFKFYKNPVKIVLPTNTIAFFPKGGPKNPFLLLSSLDIIISWVWLAEVLAEKVMKLGMYFSFGSCSRKLFVIADFPVPVGPTKSKGTLCPTYVLRKNICLAVSIVGMISSDTCYTRK